MTSVICSPTLGGVVEIHSSRDLSALLSNLSSPLVKECACGNAYTRAMWMRLPFRGIQLDGEGGRFDVRDCPCKSTILLDLPEDESVCMICAHWTGPRKLAFPEGVWCEGCGVACAGSR